MLLVPMIVAASVAGTLSVHLLLLALSALGVFMSYVPLHTVLRGMFVTEQPDERLHQAQIWAALYLCAGVAFMIPLLAQGFWFLLAIGSAGMTLYFANFFLTLRYSKTIATDLLAVAGLTLSAPCAYLVSTHSLDQTAFVLWLLNFLFFGCSVFYVHMKIRATSLRKSELTFSDRFSLGRLNVLYHVAVVAIVVGLAVGHYTPQLAFLAFVPMTLHAVYGTYRLSTRVRFKNLGLLLLGHSIVFVLILGIVQ